MEHAVITTLDRSAPVRTMQVRSEYQTDLVLRVMFLGYPALWLSFLTALLVTVS